MKKTILFVLCLFALCACELSFAQQGLSEQQLQDAIRKGLEKGVKDAQDNGTISKQDADKFLESFKTSQNEAEKRYQELQAKKAAGPSEWKEFTSKEGDFIVLLPTTPETKHLAEENGTVHHSFSSQPLGENINFTIMCWEIPQHIDRRRLPEMLELYRNKLLGTGSVRSERPVTFDGNPGKDIVLDFDKIGSSCQTRLYYTQERLYILLCTIQPMSSEFPPQAKKFFDSFARLGSPAAQARLASRSGATKSGDSQSSSGVFAQTATEKSVAFPAAKVEAEASTSDRKKTTLRYLRAAHEIDETEIPADVIKGVERALEVWRGNRLEELIVELEALRENTTRNRKAFKRYWEAEVAKR